MEIDNFLQSHSNQKDIIDNDSLQSFPYHIIPPRILFLHISMLQYVRRIFHVFCHNLVRGMSYGLGIYLTDRLLLRYYGNSLYSFCAIV